MYSPKHSPAVRTFVLPALLVALITTAAPARASVGLEYTHSLDLYKSARYGEARNAFEAVLERHPTSHYADNALYWIGETFYAEGAHQQALRTFREVARRFADQPKAPDALFKVALCNQQLGRTTEYHDALRELSGRYPDASITRHATLLLADYGYDQPTITPAPATAAPPIRQAALTRSAAREAPKQAISSWRATTPSRERHDALFIDENGMAAALPDAPSHEELLEIRRHLDEERETLAQQANDDLSVGEILLSVVAPGGLLYMFHRESEKRQAASELEAIDQDFALVERERLDRSPAATLVASNP